MGATILRWTFLACGSATVGFAGLGAWGVIRGDIHPTALVFVLPMAVAGLFTAEFAFKVLPDA